MNIYVGNLPFSVSSDELRETFQAYGEVTSAEVITDRATGRSRGFGFVEMPNEDEARAAIEALNGSQMRQRTLRVNEARSSGQRRGGSRGGYGSRGRSGGYRY